MLKREYELDDDFDAADPGNLLRDRLSKVERLDDIDDAFSELLYTAQERHIFDEIEGICLADALTIVRLWMISNGLTRQDRAALRM